MCDMAAYSNAIRISASSSSDDMSQLPIVHLHFVKQAGIAQLPAWHLQLLVQAGIGQPLPWHLLHMNERYGRSAAAV